MSENETEERVTAHSYGALENTAGASEECWMIRVPAKLAELWEKAPEGTDLGELVFTKGGSSKNKNNAKSAVKPGLSVHVSETLTDQVAAAEETATAAAASATSAAAAAKRRSSVVPRNYSLQAMTKKIPVMHPFSRNPKTGAVKLWGTVSRTANLQVEQDSNYRELLRNRLVATNITTNRFVKPVEATESVLNKPKSGGAGAVPGSSTTKGFGDAVLKYGKRALEAAQDQTLALQQSQQERLSKKARQFAPDQPLKSVVFELFSQQPYWTVKDLKAAAVAGGATEAGTKRGEAEIREVLREIGDYHRSGDHKNMWELRKEFQQTAG